MLNTTQRTKLMVAVDAVCALQAVYKNIPLSNDQAIALAICSSDISAIRVLEKLGMDENMTLSLLALIQEDKAKISRIALEIDEQDNSDASMDNDEQNEHCVQTE